MAQSGRKHLTWDGLTYRNALHMQIFTLLNFGYTIPECEIIANIPFSLTFSIKLLEPISERSRYKLASTKKILKLFLEKKNIDLANKNI